MKQGFSIAALALCGLILLAPAPASADNASESDRTPIVIARAPAQPTTRPAHIQQFLVALTSDDALTAQHATVPSKTRRASTDLPADDLVSTTLYPSHLDSPRKRNLEFSGRTGPKLRIGLKQKRVRFALNFKVVDDVFFAPAYRLAISKADFQNPEGYWAHSVFVGMRFNFNSDAK